MGDNRQRISDDPLGFIQRCVRERKIYWTYHVNMRLRGRSLSREAIVASVDNYEILESYPDDKYLPSYLVYAIDAGEAIHVVFAVDAEEDNVRVVTAYRPDPQEWGPGLRKRRTR